MNGDEESARNIIYSSTLSLSMGRLAHEIWSEDYYTALLLHIHGPNDPKRFAVSFVSKTRTFGIWRPVFCHNKTRTVLGAIHSTYQSLTGIQPIPFALVPLSALSPPRSTWTVWDFDFHNHPEGALHPALVRDAAVFIREAARLAERGIGYIVEHSGRGWHFWLISNRVLSEKEWSSLRRELDQRCHFTAKAEHLPVFNGLGVGCRVPGSPNPNTWHATREDWEVSRIFWYDLSPVELELNKKETFLFSSSADPDRRIAFEPSEPIRALLDKYRISAPHERHNQMLALIGEGVFHFGRDVLRNAAISLYNEASPTCASPLSEHLMEFVEAYEGALTSLVLPRLSPSETEVLNSLGTQSLRDVFIICQNYARRGSGQFFCSTKRLSKCVGLSFQRIAQIRAKFEREGYMQKLPGGFIPGVQAFRYQWLLKMANGP